MRTRRPIILPFVLLVSALASPLLVAQEEQWLQYRSATEARQIIGDMTYQLKEPSKGRPEGVELPEFVADPPVFILWETPMAKSGKVWLAFDKSSKTGQYDRLYIDANTDGDLSDESAQGPSRRDTNQSYFGPVKVVFEGEDGPITYHLDIQFYSRTDRTYCLLAPGCWYEGPVTVGGAKKHCVLIDYNVNGVFNDKAPDSGRADRIRIGPPDSRDTRFVGTYIEVDEKLYRPEIARDGAFIILRPAEDVAYGTVRVAQGITTLSAGGENGLFPCKPENGLFKLPVGEYRIDYWSIVKNDDQGSKWELRGQPGGRAGAFTVAQDKETELSVGEPVYSRVQVSQSGSFYSFGQSLEGRQGERIELLRNGSRPQPPRLRIRSRDGTYDRGLSFEYG